MDGNRMSNLGSIAQSVVVVGSGSANVSFGSDLRFTLQRFPKAGKTMSSSEVSEGPNERELDVLDPRTTQLELLGRDEAIRSLDNWIDNDRKISVHILTGEAGSGKTRLGVELCGLRDGDPTKNGDWLAGFLHSGALPRIADVFELKAFNWTQNTLLVIDYASQEHVALGRWLDQLAQGDELKDTKLRILLLERRAETDGGWWKDLTGQTSGEGGERRNLFHDLEPQPLPPLDAGDLEIRRKLLSAALDKTNALFPDQEQQTIPALGTDEVYDQRLGEEQFGSPLNLVMAGVLSHSQGPQAALALRRLDAADRLAEHELRRIERVADGTNDKNASYFAGFNNLAGGLPTNNLLGTLKSELAASGLVDNQQSLAKLLKAEFPPKEHQDTEGTKRLSTTEPDLIGEALIIQAMKAVDVVEPRGTVRRAYDVGGSTMATAFVRLLQDYAYPLADPGAPENEQKTAGELLDWLKALAESDLPLEELEPLALALPYQSLVLHKTGLSLSTKLAKGWQERLTQEPSVYALYKACDWFFRQSGHLSVAGQREAALGAAERAVQHGRALVEIDENLFLDDLAAAVGTQANMLSDLGRREDAFDAAEEAAQLFRRLAEARPDAFTPDLAASLNNLAARLSELGHREDALNAAEEAAQLFRRLAEARPDAFTPDLAASLNTLANRLSSLGRREDALNAANEAAQLFRRLAEARPDAFTPDLATSLNTLANRLSSLGRREDALNAANEAAQLFRRLAEARPDAFTPDLATSLNTLANMLSSLGRREDALNAANEAVSIRRRLAGARPDAFTPGLASSLNNLANMLSSLGRREDALNAANEAVSIRRRLAGERPDAFTPDLASSLNNLANILSELGRREDALNAANEAVSIRRRLAGERPDAFTPGLASSLNNLANMLSELGRREDALNAAEEAAQLYRRLAEARPGAFTPDLATSLNTLANMLSSLGRREDALNAANEAVSIRRRLAGARPDAFTPGLASSLNNLANMLSSLGRREDALNAANEAVSIRRRLAGARPDAFTIDLCVSLGMMSDILRASGQAERAWSANCEAIATLMPVFHVLPQAVAQWMGMHLNRHLQLAEELGRVPDLDLIGSALQWFNDQQQS